MELQKIGSFFILACFLLVLLPATVAAASSSTPAPLIALPNLLQEKSKTQWSGEDFRQAGMDAKKNGNYQEAIDNFNAAETMFAKDPLLNRESYGGYDPKKLALLAQIEHAKSETYDDWSSLPMAQVDKDDLERRRTAATDRAEVYDNLVKNTGTEGPTGSGCLIVTATFGSPLASEVQLVRDFRDHSISQSYTGSRFMPGFNTWYYSFSPQVSSYINDHPFTKPAMQVILTPLLGIVRVSQIGYSLLAFNPELATFAALIIGSTMYAGFYVFPFVVAIMGVAQGRGWKGWNIQNMKPVAGVWAAIAVLLVLGVLLSLDLLTTVASGLFVVATIILVAGGLSVSLLQYTHTPKVS
jgi:peptide/nickel transport system substrate-binding protein